MWVRASRLRPGCRRAPASTGEASFRTSGGEIGGCVGADHRIPVAHGDAGDPAGAVDRQVRLGLELGGVVGDIDDPSTTVPVLDGGFDPLQIVLGAARGSTWPVRPSEPLYKWPVEPTRRSLDRVAPVS